MDRTLPDSRQRYLQWRSLLNSKTLDNQWIHVVTGILPVGIIWGLTFKIHTKVYSHRMQHLWIQISQLHPQTFGGRPTASINMNHGQPGHYYWNQVLNIDKSQYDVEFQPTEERQKIKQGMIQALILVVGETAIRNISCKTTLAFQMQICDKKNWSIN